MNAKTEARGDRLDGVKMALALLVVAAGIFAFYFFSDYALLVRVVGLLVAGGIAAAIAYRTQTGRGVWAFMVDARAEVRKVVWPTKQETIQTTLIVFAMVVVVAIILWFLDMFLFWAVKFVTGQGG